MGNSLFAPDIFSRPRPAFYHADQAACAEVGEILQRHYAFSAEQIQSVERLEGLEINSQNFKVVTAVKTYALKKSGVQVKKDDVAIQLSLSQALRQGGVPFAAIITTVNDNFFAQDGDRLWILSDFVEGTYFTGTYAELDVVAQAVALLQAQLDQSDAAQDLPLFGALNSWSNTVSIFTALFERSAEWPELFPASEAAALLAAQSRLEHVFYQTVGRLKNIVNTPAPVHIDLHPHNILMGPNDVPVIIDLDSLQRADRVQSLGFAIFKLVRQHIVQERPSDFSAPARHFFKRLNISEADIALYETKATAEVLRRIGIIADLNMNKGNRDWNAVLHIHLAALDEIPHIFGSKE